MSKGDGTRWPNRAITTLGATSGRANDHDNQERQEQREEEL